MAVLDFLQYLAIYEPRAILVITGTFQDQILLPPLHTGTMDKPLRQSLICSERVSSPLHYNLKPQRIVRATISRAWLRWWLPAPGEANRIPG